MYPSADTIRVLHVDDEQGLAETTAEFLERVDERIEVVTATDAASGFDRLEAEEFDCIVSDYDMPGDNGIAFLERVRASYPDLPFVLFTGKGSEEVASRAISAGVTDYLQKETGTDQYAILANRIANAVDRQRAERAAERRERRLQTALDNLPFPAYVVDDDLVYRISNEAHARFHGMAVDDVEGAHAGDVLEEEAFAAFREDCLDVLERGVTKDVPEVRVPDASGETRVLDARLVPLEGVEGSTDSVLGVTIDVTETRRNQRELRERNRELEAVLDAAPAGIFLKRPDGQYIRFNETAREWAGVDADRDAAELSDGEIFSRELVEKVRADDERAFERGETVEMEETLPLADESQTVLTRKHPVYDDDGEPYAICAVVTDITEYKRRERELRRYEAMVHAMRDAACIYDAEGRFLVVNDYLVEFYDTTREDLLGTESALVAHVRESEADCDPYERLVAGEREEIRGEYEGEIRDGSRDVIDYRLARVTVDDEFEGVVGIGRDVTDRRERERQLERQNERLAEFASTVSHDLRNPLHVARARTELVREECDTPHAAEVADALDRMSALIDDLLTLARGGEVAVDLEPVDLAAITRNCWEQLDTGAARLVVQTDLELLGDPEKFPHLLENLLANAVVHGSPEGPRGAGVTVTVGDCEGGFFVADDGPGIAPEDRETVFGAGYSTDDDGTGFGLRIVQRVAEAHGWTVSVTGSQAGGASDERGESGAREATSAGARFEVTGIDDR